MSEDDRQLRTQIRLSLDIARDLTSIVSLYDDLEDEALHRYDSNEMPGGDALVMLGPVANLEAWNYRQLSDMMGRTNAKGGFDDPFIEAAPPLLVLAGWVDIIRTERDQPTSLRASIRREADYLRKSLDWMLSVDDYGDAVFLAVDELARDLADVVRRLEDVLHDGVRSETTRVTCIVDRCDEKPRLVKVWGDDHREDSWKCPSCREPYNTDEYLRAAATHMHELSQGERWLKVSDAAASIGRPDRTIRTWINQGKLSTQRTPWPSTIYVLWDDVRTAHTNARVIEIRRKARRVA